MNPANLSTQGWTSKTHRNTRTSFPPPGGNRNSCASQKPHPRGKRPSMSGNSARWSGTKKPCSRSNETKNADFRPRHREVVHNTTREDRNNIHAAWRVYRWCNPPTCGRATTSPSKGGSTSRGFGELRSRDKWHLAL